MDKVITVVGARPQFIKMAAVSGHLRKRFKEIILHTGQHYDKEMSENFFDELVIPKPDYNLGIHSVNQRKYVGRMLAGIEKILIKQKPGLVIVYGDTDSTLAGALACAKLDIPLAHVEAGLRSFNRQMPEETNRLITDYISRFLFCPTKTAVSNLKKEGIKKGVSLVGDVMYDSIRAYLPRARSKSKILAQLGITPGKYYLLTIHRAGNTQDLKRLKKILSSIDSLDLPCVFPVHPRTRKFLANTFKPGKRLRLIAPVSYLDMLILEEKAKLILTDSGGIQKEAYILKVPCLTLRKETEWVETLRHGCNRIVDVDREDLARICRRLNKRDLRFYPHLYGDGQAAKKIVEILDESMFN